MAAKDIKFHDSARNRIVAGVNLLADAVKGTLGITRAEFGALRRAVFRSHAHRCNWLASEMTRWIVRSVSGRSTRSAESSISALLKIPTTARCPIRT